MRRPKKRTAVNSALELIERAGCTMKKTDLLSLLRSVYKAGYKMALKDDSESEEEEGPRLPYL